ncbi:MAG: hypothetical protein AB1452_03735 [Pseudomonadota bacterium]
MLVKIYTVHDKRVEFLKWQHATLRRHLEEPYRLIACDNATARLDSLRLRLLCWRLGSRYLAIPGQHHENANIAASYPLDYLTQEHVAREREADFSVFMDSDMFLVRRFSFRRFAGEYAIAGVRQTRGALRYLWNGLVVFNHRLLADAHRICWACSGSSASPYHPSQHYRDGRLCGEYVDVGGPTHLFLDEHPALPVRWIDMDRVTRGSPGMERIPEQARADYAQFAVEELASDFLADGAFFHYRAGSNWNRMNADQTAAKTRVLEAVLARALES